MSHHLDAPAAAQNRQLYIDDLYVFSADDSTVFVMDVNSTITEPNVKPGFHPEARYEFKVHRNRAVLEDLTYRVSFAPPAGDGTQVVRVHELTGDDARSDSATGRLLVEGRTGRTADGSNVRLWAGRIADSFYIDLSVLFKVNAAVKDGTAPDLSAWNPEEARNSFTDTTVDSIVLAVSHQAPGLRPGTPIGVWGATKLATDAGGWRQINRAGHPMMWPIFWPDDTRFTYPANTRHPSEDQAAIGDQMAKQIATLVSAMGTSEDAEAYGAAVAQMLLPDVLSYVVGTSASYSFAGLNGRTLADNAPEVMLSLVTGTAIPSGLTPSVAQHLRRPSFPYVVPA